MKTKEEVIKEAWGRYWNEVKQNVKGMGTIGGWADNDIIHYNEDLGCDSIGFEFYGSLYRPKSLSGIENNNGWIRIESEEDLPKENGTYFTKTRHDDIVRVEIIATEGLEGKDLQWYVSHFTHYQPIFKPKPPIY